MRSNVQNITERLAALLQPPAKLDRYDEMAIDMIASAASLSFKDARELIAAQLRLVHCEGERAGIEACRKAVAS
jgi:hypothetical protein